MDSRLATGRGQQGRIEDSLRLMQIGVRFIETEDRSVLLDLPVELRSLLEPEFDRYLLASGKVRDELEDEVDHLIETIKRKRKSVETSLDAADTSVRAT